MLLSSLVSPVFRQSWTEALEKTLSPRDLVDEGVEVAHLLPATRYVVRVTAGNHLGRSSPSEELVFATGIEKPSVPPREVSLEAQGSREVRVRWKPPLVEYAQGHVLGFYVGYAPKEEFRGR